MVKMHFDTLNRVSVDNECDGRTDGQTERHLAIARRVRCALKEYFAYY